MVEIIYRTLTVTVGATSSSEVTFSVAEDYKWKVLLVSERGGAALNNVHFTILIAGNSIIKDSMPLSMVGSTLKEALVIERDLPAGTETKIKITNNTGSSVTLDLTLQLEKA